MGTMNRGGFYKTLEPGFRKIVMDKFRERSIEGKLITNQNTSKRAYEEDFELAGLGALQLKAEGQQIVYQSGIQGGTKRYTWQTFGLGYRITREMWEDDLYGVFGSKFSKSLGRSARNNQEVIMHAPYNNAFDTAYTGFKTGEALCGDHTSLRGVTQRNRPNTDVDFGLLAFQAAIEHFHSLQSEEGFPILLIPRKVIHSAGDHWIVSQVLKSQYLPGGNQNDINQAAMEGCTPHLSHYLTDADAWFVLADEHDINYFNRRPFSFRSGEDDDTWDAKFNGTQRHGSGWGEWRGVYGSTGV